jgi:hypothetical protein
MNSTPVQFIGIELVGVVLKLYNYGRGKISRNAGGNN